MKLNHTINLPTKLTLVRLIISPLLLPMLLVYLLPYDHMVINMILALIFLAFSFTDFLDGYFARKYQMATKLGGSLDHIADKFLTYSTFIGLLTVHKIYFFWVILFIGRDIFVMGLRQIALENNFSIKVDYIGKLKTALQMILITWLIARPITYIGAHASTFYYGEIVLLCITILVTLASCYHYYSICADQFDYEQTAS